ELDWIVMKALEKDRNRRYETANALALDVRRYLQDEPVQAGPPSKWYRFRKFTRRHKSALTVVAVAACALLLVVGSLGWMLRDRTLRQSERAQAVRESLEGGRTAMQAKDLTLARQKLAEARALLGKEEAALPELARDVDNLRADVEARRGAQERFRDFLDQIEQAHESEIPQGAAAGESLVFAYRNPRAAILFIRRALALYGVTDQRDWPARLDRGFLQPEQVTQIRRLVYEKLLWLADDILTRNEDHATGATVTGPAAARQALAYLKEA